MYSEITRLLEEESFKPMPECW